MNNVPHSQFELLKVAYQHAKADVTVINGHRTGNAQERPKDFSDVRVAIATLLTAEGDFQGTRYVEGSRARILTHIQNAIAELRQAGRFSLDMTLADILE